MTSTLLHSSGDTRLMEALRSRDERALKLVYDRYGARVFAAALRIVGDRGIAEDVTQEVFLHLWSNVEQIDLNRGDLQAFLVTVAKRRGIDFIRSQECRRRRERRATTMSATSGYSGTQPDCADEIIRAEMTSRNAQTLQAALSTLSDAEREAVDLAYFAGYTLREVAKATSSPEGTTKSRVRRALRRLERNPSLVTAYEC